MTTEMIAITKKQYDTLIEDSNWLRFLEAAGVDNWDGYDFARELSEEDEPSLVPPLGHGMDLEDERDE
jgi:hypothetical protein